MIKPLPQPSGALADSKYASNPRPFVKFFGAENPAHEQMAAVPREFKPNPPESAEGTQTDMSDLRGLFTGKVRQKIARAKYYPGIARRRGMEGQPVIAFTLNKWGRLTGVQLAQSSGYQLLDQAALEAVQKAEPYPEIPAELNTDTFQFKLPISFILK